MSTRLVKPGKRGEARRRLEELIRRRSLWGQRLAGEREVAGELGISRKTLRSALAELEAAGLLDRRHGSGTYVAGRPAGARRAGPTRLAIIAETHHEDAPGWDYRGEMIRGALAQAPRSRAGCTVLALDRPEEAERIGSDREMRGFAGFILARVEDPGLITRLLDLRRGPVVLLDHYLRDLPVIGVVDGSFEGARAVARHLVALGHRRIGFIDTFNSAAANPEKLAGYRVGLAERGVPFDERLVIAPSAPVAADGPDLETFVSGAVERLLGAAEPPTAIFGFDDSRALPAARALEARGFKVGADFAVAGFGDSAIRRGLGDWLTSCRIYPRRMGREALLAALTAPAGSGGRTVIVPNRLAVRRSTCPPPEGQRRRP